MRDMMVRGGELKDAEKCAEIVSSWISNTEWMPRLYTQPELATMIKEAIPHREFWVSGDPVIGYLSFNVELSQVSALYTAIQGKGVGKALIDKIKERYHYINLWSHKANEKAHRFYHREGFRISRLKEKGGDGIPEMKFEWRQNLGIVI